MSIPYELISLRSSTSYVLFTYKWHDDDRNEHLAPVHLLGRLGGCDNDADAEGAHRDEHDEADGRMREHETSHARSEQTADNSRTEFGARGERRKVADCFEEAKGVEDPDSEGAPAETDTAENEVDAAGHGVSW
jgi:hypothetical protein